MSVENNLIQKTRDMTITEPMQKAIMHTGKPSAARLEIQKQLLANYVPVVMEHIAKHGCSGLKCKRCPLNNVCDRNAAHSKDLANQMIVYANTQRVK